MNGNQVFKFKKHHNAKLSDTKNKAKLILFGFLKSKYNPKSNATMAVGI
ncbi:hypothetical protein K2X96_01000 [Patescibacteria group bacterium]|nr:hypothetical protein [Patescibacteria group bacterium]